MIGTTAAVRGDGSRPDGSALVSTPISQRNNASEIQFFKRSIRIRHLECGNNNLPPDRSTTTLQGFSAKSRSRLRFVATNNSHRVKSQFGLTYHHGFPTDGRTSKKHLNAFLTWLRRNVPDIGYLWIMEFQTRKAVHYHLYLTILPDAELWEKMASAWVRIIGETDDCLWWHGPKRGENWVPWDIGTGQYLAKYLDKESQKHIPEGYHNFGRFWGNSSCMKPEFIGMPLENLNDLSTIDEKTGEIYGGKETVLRWLGILAKKQTNGYSRFKERVCRSSYTLLDGMKAYDQIERYFSNLNQKGTTIHDTINSRASDHPSLQQDDDSTPCKHDGRRVDFLSRQSVPLAPVD